MAKNNFVPRALAPPQKVSVRALSRPRRPISGSQVGGEARRAGMWCAEAEMPVGSRLESYARSYSMPGCSACRPQQPENARARAREVSLSSHRARRRRRSTASRLCADSPFRCRHTRLRSLDPRQGPAQPCAHPCCGRAAPRRGAREGHSGRRKRAPASSGRGFAVHSAVLAVIRSCYRNVVGQHCRVVGPGADGRQAVALSHRWPSKLLLPSNRISSPIERALPWSGAWPCRRNVSTIGGVPSPPHAPRVRRLVGQPWGSRLLRRLWLESGAVGVRSSSLWRRACQSVKGASLCRRHVRATYR